MKMLGLMMDQPLLIRSIVRHALLLHPAREIVSVVDGTVHRYEYRDAFARSAQLAHALQRLALRRGDRVATLAWNDFRHFEIYYGASCSGLVCHTINPRLFEEQIAYIVNHAADRCLFVDPAFVPLAEKLQERASTIERYIVLCDRASMPDTTLRNAISYEAFIENEATEFEWPEFDERTASSLCYTSGTTGDPKGVLYSHRSTILQCYAAALPDSLNLSAHDTVMPIVPMFHVNAWSLPYISAMVGAKLVLPGPRTGDAASLQRLIQSERVTFAAGVPTVWQGLLAHLETTGNRVDSLRRVLAGGSAVPVALADRLSDYGIEVMHAWGMTETSPIGTVNRPSPQVTKFPPAAKAALRAKQGRPLFGIEIKVTNDANDEVPHDGIASGALKVRGPWVASRYFGTSGSSEFDSQGWFATGDVATICPLGYMHITDRTKDLIKSGGEWISSIELESIAVTHPAVAQAAVIAKAHARWQERPLLVVVLKPGAMTSSQALLEFFEDKVAKWWIPDAVELVDALPLTATGKISKLQLRERFP